MLIKRLIRGEKPVVVEGKLLPEESSLAIIHDKDAKRWYVIDLPTGLSVSTGITKKECIARYEVRKETYRSIILAPFYKERIKEFNDLCQTLKKTSNKNS